MCSRSARVALDRVTLCEANWSVVSYLDQRTDESGDIEGAAIKRLN